LGLHFFFLRRDGVFEFHFGLLFCLPCDCSNHQFLLWSLFQKKTIHFVNFGGFFVFLKFKGLQFSSCHFGGPYFLSFLCERGGCFALVNFECFFLLFWNSNIFKKNSCHFLGFQKNIVWSFARGYLPFFLWTLKVFCFCILKFWSFQFFFLSFYCSSQKIVWSFTRGARGYLPFFLWTLKVFCFSILKFWNL